MKTFGITKERVSTLQEKAVVEKIKELKHEVSWWYDKRAVRVNQLIEQIEEAMKADG